MLNAAKNELEFQYNWLNTTHTNCILLPSLKIISPGVLNHDAGPDFTNASVLMDGLIWHGNIELHITSKDWYRHNHHKDAAYNNVILHVVLEGVGPVQAESGAWIPTVNVSNIELAAKSMNTAALNEQTLSQLAKQRLIRYSEMYGMLLRRSGNNSLKAILTWIAMAFGRPQNDLPFEQLLKRVRFESLVKMNADRRASILLYYSGLCDPETFHPSELGWLNSVGAHLGFVPMQKHQWKCSRMRPVNLPTNRLLQFNELLSFHSSFVQLLGSNKSVSACAHIFSDLLSNGQGMGTTFINKLLINAFLPIIVYERKRVGFGAIEEEAFQFLETLPAEDNYVLRKLCASNQLKFLNASSTQGALEYLYKQSSLN